MIRLGLIGYPLSHSLSPLIHTAALHAAGLDGIYSLFPIPPDDKHGLKGLLELVRIGEITGLNVTIPHKQHAIEFLDELTPTAQAIGAVNTIYVRNNKLIGENTDAPGFLADLKRFLTAEMQRHGVNRALVLGAGGSARAIVYALLKDGWEVTIAARRLEQAQQLADYFANYKLRITLFPPSPLHAKRRLYTLSLIINATPIGMTPNVDRSPWPENLSFPPHARIYDLVYNPQETKLVREARAQGRPATTGLGMLVEQAALAFEIWTGIHLSRDIMRASVEKSPVSNF
ncbi:MAG TPA: shikimate dehydrogenase [Anaerolineales bacterium]|jgi:shikimate dehydrogenase|nr:shikimate dehydrogenase [Anaerolineales bacterium]